MQKKEAVALKYNKKNDNAPKVVAKGKGNIAENILKKAKEYNIPIKEDPDLLEVLSKLDIYEEIPPKLYKAVANILIFIYNNKKEKK
ncbi:EscU/YscU/HrcU family type III secretion system export apparatus switch protein [Nitrosophilus kaiyonis]|uniref:EscU/YscU/HrcU family type III secretion system export apparatus switch protein n=1 Tax=Nitrosophilus kaiyonis TaxID=2930200 RepID=UPI00249046F7|nr:EscU/YscU/HrcU family type III secretion system export apparatus switch protein [Nitrosophilus kaiyonis]